VIVDDLTLEERNGSCEVSARVREERAGSEQRIWYSFPAEFRPSELDASPYLPGLLLACMSVGEPLSIDGPVSARLLAAAERAKDVYRSWWPRLADVDVSAAPHAFRPAGDGAAGCFFTRGVDSWYSVLSGVAGAPESRAVPITVLLYCPTADFIVGRPRAPRQVRATAAGRVREAAERLGCEAVVIDSNLRAFVEPILTWGRSHGALLASIGLALGSHLARVHIAATLSLGNLVPLGSHPLLDALWSTERTEIVHDGAEATRIEKLRFLASRPVALERLKVCINQSPDVNCGKCPKCVRTMIGLELAGALNRCPTYGAAIDVRRVAQLVPRHDLDRAFTEELIAGFGDRGDHRSIYAALKVAMARYHARHALRTARSAVRRLLGRS
jgi:hypothetical protein